MKKVTMDIDRMLEKIGIKELNKMQQQAHEAISAHNATVLLSPTGSGKTLAFLLPLILGLTPDLKKVQALVIVPSRELALQIEQVARNLGSGYKINAFYGGISFGKDVQELGHPPAILIGTPGRIHDHMRRATFDMAALETLVLDEFDKSLEIGFEDDMSGIINTLSSTIKKVLTSATQKLSIPDFVKLGDYEKLDFLKKSKPSLKVILVDADADSQEEKLIYTLQYLKGKNGIVFCNFRDTIAMVSDYLSDAAINHGCFYGGLEQKDRERALIKFRNSTYKILIATDLAARGLDIPEMDFIIHYELPPRLDEYTHRNGRTARMHAEGAAYILKVDQKKLPVFVDIDKELVVPAEHSSIKSEWSTLFVSGGRRDKISKGDLAGLFFKQGNLEKNELGVIELKQDCAFVGVVASKAKDVAARLNNAKIKKRKVRVKVI